MRAARALHRHSQRALRLIRLGADLSVLLGEHRRLALLRGAPPLGHRVHRRALAAQRLRLARHVVQLLLEQLHPRLRRAR